MKYKNWSLYKKIWSLIAILLILSATSVTYTIYSLKSIHSTITVLSSVHYEASALSSQLTDQQRFMVIQTRNLLIENDNNKLGEIIKNFSDARNKQEKIFVNILPLLDSEANEEINKYRTGREKWFPLIDQAYKLKLQGQTEEAKKIIFTAQTDILNPMLKNLENIRSHTAVVASTAAEDASDQVKKSSLIAILLGILSAILSTLIAFILIKNLKSSIQKIITTLSENSRNVASASYQIASTADELSQASTEQAASLEQTSSSIEEMNSMVMKNSENATRAAETTAESREQAYEGQKVVSKMIMAMGEINKSNNLIMERVENSNKQITEIVEVIKEIGAKTKIINDIVFQTKLLSFNASVEAARAGEEGKGFAVVAEEIGNLAAMSGNAAREISELLDSSINRVEVIVNETKTKVKEEVNSGIEKVRIGTEIANQCGELLNTIVKEVSEISKMAEEISIASNEQAQGVNEISKAITQLDIVTQQNSATSEETASAAEELSAQAESLNSAVLELVAAIEGDINQDHKIVDLKKQSYPSIGTDSCDFRTNDVG